MANRYQKHWQDFARRVDGCDKAGFPGKGSALQAVKSMRARKRQDYRGLRPYYCRDCGYWHIGHGERSAK